MNNILKDAAEKIRAFNELPRDNPVDYHFVLLIREGKNSLVDREGDVSDKPLGMVTKARNLYNFPFRPPSNCSLSDKPIEVIEKALRGYFKMNRRNMMGSEEEFMGKLTNILGSAEIKSILARFRDATIMSCNLDACRSDVEKLYEYLSNPQTGLSADRTRFCVGTTKTIHCLLPELFVLVDSTVAEVVLVRSYGYNNFSSYWKVMEICRGELVEWQELYGSTDSLLELDPEPSTLTRIFDKCAHAMAMDK